MASFKFKGFTYDLRIRPWKKGKAKYETLKWKTGLKCTRESISFEEFEKARLEAAVMDYKASRSTTKSNKMERPNNTGKPSETAEKKN